MIIDKKIAEAVAILKEYEPPEGYYVAFSGGKDSLCVYWLTKIAGVKADYHYNMTTVDPPELMQFIKTFEDVEIKHPGVDKTMWNLIIKKGIPPNRSMRYCCKELKENSSKGRVTILGVRAEESAKRRNRNVIAFDSPLGKIINLIYDWTEEDVWSFINCNLIDYCKLYDEGYDRLGCVGCPLAYHTKVESDFERYPLYMKAYINSFDRMLKYQKSIGKERKTWKTALEVFDWWVYSNAYISKKRLSKYPTECSGCKYLGHKLMCEFYCDLISNKEFLKNV